VKYKLRAGPSDFKSLDLGTFQKNVIPEHSPLYNSSRKMSTSRWANDDPETEAIIAQQKHEKEQKRRAKAEKQRQLEEAKAQQAREHESNTQAPNGESGPPTKRRRLSNDHNASAAEVADINQEQRKQSTLLRFPAGEWGTCRHVDNFEKLNHIEEGSYGWVSRAKDISTGEIVALKKLKLENSPDGFPVTGLREIQTLLEARHQNVVYLREVVMGNKMDE
jgi:cell division cycle 2-like protein